MTCWGEGAAAAFALLAAVALPACGELVGLDEFHAGPTTTAQRAVACGDHGVIENGKCVETGVSACGAGFTADGHGGCTWSSPETCPSGEYALPGVSTCSSVGACNQSGVQSLSQGGTNRFVRAGIAGGDGSMEHPFGKIEDALADLKALGALDELPFVVIEPGTYRVNLEVDFPVALTGNCAGDPNDPADAPLATELVATDPTMPVVKFTPGATIGKSARQPGLVEVGIRQETQGPGPGVVVDGADGVFFQFVRIHDLSGPGIVATGRLPDGSGVTGPATLRVGAGPGQGVLIERTRGAGIVSYGMGLSLNGVEVRETLPPESAGEDACGICLRASPFVPTEVEADAVPAPGDWDARRVGRPSLAMNASVLADNAGTGLSVIGSDATVTDSIVIATAAGGVAAQAVGIEVEEMATGDVPASLHLNGVIVEGASAEGINARDAMVTIENSVIGKAGAHAATANGAKRCLGNGIRFRWDRPNDTQVVTPLVVTSTLVDGTRETGVLVEGASAELDHVLIQNTNADDCAGDLGDGIGVYGDAGASAAIHVVGSRIRDSHRADIAAFGGAQVSSMTIESSLLSDREAIAVDAGVPEPVFRQSGCGARGTESCHATPGSLTPALLGGRGCDPEDDTVCAVACFADSGTAARAPLPGLVWWVKDHDETAPVVAGADGCAEIEGLPQNAEVVLADYMPTLPAATDFDATMNQANSTFTSGEGLLSTGSDDSLLRAVLPGNGSYGVLQFIQGVALGARPNAQLDLRTAPLLAVFTCALHPEDLPPTADACRDVGRALAGIEYSLDVPGVTPIYVGSVAPEPPDVLGETVAEGLGALGLFAGVPAGEHRVTLTSADPSKSVHCSFDTRSYPVPAGKTEKDNVFRFRAIPGFTTAVWAYCSLE